MVKRKARRHRQYLGSRSHGRGNAKCGRGSGERGGVGNAGMCKHKGSWIALHDKDYYGRSSRGFVNLAKKKPMKKLAHLYDINHKALTGKLEKKGEKYVFEFRGKILSTGNVTVPVSIKALEWSGRTEEKVKAAGGDMAKLERK
ncbi:uL15 family ribosomal protein [Candidatus Micrarchaeota archaeon]|nr:uL15 family ribosomal protein [Candidatus Micrarchaeota archaeon]